LSIALSATQCRDDNSSWLAIFVASTRAQASEKLWPGMERKNGPKGATFHPDEPKYGEYTQKDGDILSCTSPPGESELDITQV
jgi:hypothetical protein